MTEEVLVAFYRQIRENDALMRRLFACPDDANLIAAVLREAEASGFSFQPADVELVLSDLTSFIAIANDDELTDHELELVAAGGSQYGQGKQ